MTFDPANNARHAVIALLALANVLIYINLFVRLFP